ncbi:hypothetical protein EV356DRAFT_504829, partial [Viridothelium virens]
MHGGIQVMKSLKALFCYAYPRTTSEMIVSTTPAISSVLSGRIRQPPPHTSVILQEF